MEHCDHLKPLAWKGELVARSCDPQAAWSTGRACAEEILQAHHFSANFKEVFSQENVDMLRPFPDGIYPGICADPDPSMSISSQLPLLTGHELVDDDGDEDYEDELDDEVDVSMDDILDEPPASAELHNTAGDDWLEHEGHKYHKASLLRIIFCSDFTMSRCESLV
jgi:hypothetical protein